MTAPTTIFGSPSGEPNGTTNRPTIQQMCEKVWTQPLKARLNLLVYTSAEELSRAMGEVIEFYNQRRYHEGIGNVTPTDVYYGRREEILKRREEQKQRTLHERFQYNRGQKLNRATGESETQNRSLSDASENSQRC